MTTADRVVKMSEQERALFLSIFHVQSWKKHRKKNWQQAVQQFATALNHVENNTHPAILQMIYGHPQHAYPEQLKRILSPYFHGVADQRVVARELRQRLEMIKAWPPEWLNEDKVMLQ